MSTYLDEVLKPWRAKADKIEAETGVRPVGKPLVELTKEEAKAWLAYFDRHPEKRPVRAFGEGPTDWEKSLRKIVEAGE